MEQMAFTLHWHGPGWYRITGSDEGDMTIEWAYPFELEILEISSLDTEGPIGMFYQFASEEQARETIDLEGEQLRRYFKLISA